MLSIISSRHRGEGFVSLWETTTANETISLPYDVGGTYTGTIDWGDGEVVPNTYSNRSHEYTISGQYIVTIRGDINPWAFNNTGDVTKILTIENLYIPTYGTGAYYGCSNLDITSGETVSFKNTDNSHSFFRDCNLSSLTNIDFNNSNTLRDIIRGTNYGSNIVINNNISDNAIFSFHSMTGNGSIEINSSSIANLTGFNSNRGGFNNNINLNLTNPAGVNCFQAFSNNGALDVEIIFGAGFKPINTFQAFFACSIYNHMINWNNSMNTNMESMFYNAFDYNQPLSHLDYSSVRSLNLFMFGKSSVNYNATYYDDLLIKWDTDLVFANMTNVNIGMGTIKYTAAGATAHANLVGKGFIIADGGQV